MDDHCLRPNSCQFHTLGDLHLLLRCQCISQYTFSNSLCCLSSTSCRLGVEKRQAQPFGSLHLLQEVRPNDLRLCPNGCQFRSACLRLRIRHYCIGAHRSVGHRHNHVRLQLTFFHTHDRLRRLITDEPCARRRECWRHHGAHLGLRAHFGLSAHLGLRVVISHARSTSCNYGRSQMLAAQKLAQLCPQLCVVQQAFKPCQISDAKKVETSLNHASELTTSMCRRIHVSRRCGMSPVPLTCCAHV